MEQCGDRATTEQLVRPSFCVAYPLRKDLSDLQRLCRTFETLRENDKLVFSSSCTIARGIVSAIFDKYLMTCSKVPCITGGEHSKVND